MVKGMQDLIFRSFEEAEKVRKQLRYILEKYGALTVADLLCIADRESTEEDDYVGWTYIDWITISRYQRNFYLLELPETTTLYLEEIYNEPRRVIKESTRSSCYQDRS